MSQSFSPEFCYDEISQFAKSILTRTHHRPVIGIVCGSGLGTLTELVTEADFISYDSITNFPVSTVPGHQGNFVFGKLGGKTVVCMQGRFHPYEGYSTQKCTLPIRVMHEMGVRTLIATNASGGLNPHYNVGDICVIKDHINLPGLNGLSPLAGPNDERMGVRFQPLSDAYDRSLQRLALSTAKDLGYGSFTHNGVYAMQFGPCFETVAEARMLHMLGGDIVGMSTTHEVIVARHSGMRCLALSLVTNKVVQDYDAVGTANHQEVLETGRQRAEVVKTLVVNIVQRMDEE